jgi:hypothetical protein
MVMSYLKVAYDDPPRSSDIGSNYWIKTQEEDLQKNYKLFVDQRKNINTGLII